MHGLPSLHASATKSDMLIMFSMTDGLLCVSLLMMLNVTVNVCAQHWLCPQKPFAVLDSATLRDEVIPYMSADRH
jgi:hypothetical protein